MTSSAPLERVLFKEAVESVHAYLLSAPDKGGSNFDDQRWTAHGGGVIEVLEDTGSHNRRVLVHASGDKAAKANVLANHLVHPDSVLKSCDEGLGLMFWAQEESGDTCFRFVFAKQSTADHFETAVSKAQDHMRKLHNSTCSQWSYPAIAAATLTTPAKSSTENLTSPVVSATWKCDDCMASNPHEKEMCMCCEALKPNAASAPVAKSVFAFTQPDAGTTWKCDECMTSNAADNQACVCCETVKPGAKPAAAKNLFATNQPAATSSFSFGGGSATAIATPSFSFGKSPAEASSGVPMFGSSASAAGPAKPVFSFNSSGSTDSSGPILFGTTASESATKEEKKKDVSDVVDATEKLADSAAGAGYPPATTAKAAKKKSLFGSTTDVAPAPSAVAATSSAAYPPAATAKATKQKSLFGNTVAPVAATAASSSAAYPPAATAKATKKTSLFGDTSTTPAARQSAGYPPPSTAKPTKNKASSIFGNSTATPAPTTTTAAAAASSSAAYPPAATAKPTKQKTESSSSSSAYPPAATAKPTKQKASAAYPPAATAKAASKPSASQASSGSGYPPASTAKPATKSAFRNTSATNDSTATPTKPSLFGNGVFGSTSETDKSTPFGSTKADTAAAKPSMFGASASSGASVFGSTATTPSTTPSVFGSSVSTPVKSSDSLSLSSLSDAAAGLEATPTKTNTNVSISTPVAQAISTPSAATPATPGGNPDFEATLTAIYQEHNPSKLASIPTLLVKYKGKEVQMFASLAKKYGIENLKIKSTPPAPNPGFGGAGLSPWGQSAPATSPQTFGASTFGSGSAFGTSTELRQPKMSSGDAAGSDDSDMDSSDNESDNGDSQPARGGGAFGNVVPTGEFTKSSFAAPVSTTPGLSASFGSASFGGGSPAPAFQQQPASNAPGGGFGASTFGAPSFGSSAFGSAPAPAVAPAPAAAPMTPNAGVFGSGSGGGSGFAAYASNGTSTTPSNGFASFGASNSPGWAGNK